MVYWDDDDRKDLLVGQGDGRIRLYLNVGTDDDPTFDGGTFLQVGEPGFKTDIDVGSRATETVVDWNNDDRKDLVVGALDGKIRIYLNEGTEVAPDFRSVQFAQADGADLVVPSARSSPVILDVDGDGKKDLLTGNTNGQLLFYDNTGTDPAPSFSGYSFVESNGVPIGLSASRSRPFVGDWMSDDRPDVLIGASDGNVHLYQERIRGDFDGDGDVDLDDYAAFLDCFTGPEGGGPAPSVCTILDFDDDSDVDLLDWGGFQAAFTGP